MTSRTRALALALAVALLATACADPLIPEVVGPPTPSPTASPTPRPTAAAQATPTSAPFESEPGLTADIMRIAVIADGDSPEVGAEGADAVWQAVQAWAQSVNDTGRLANRIVEVEPIDSAVFSAAAAIDRVCNGDFFAIVGSASLNDNDGLAQLESGACALPDFPARTFTLDRLESAVTFVSNPVNSPTWNAGFARYFSTAEPFGAEAAATMIVEIPSLFVGGEQMIEAATAQGYDFVYSPVIGIDADYQALAQDLMDSGARSLTWPNSGIDLLAVLEAVRTVAPDYAFDFVDCAQRCYDPAWVEAAQGIGEGVSVWLPTLPIEEADLNDELLRYLFFLRANWGAEAVLTSLGVSAWSAALLFEEAVNRAVGTGTADYDPASLTRQSVIEAAQGITEWDARGLQGISNPAERIPSACFVVLTLTAGTWERGHPERRGEFDCDPENLVELALTATSGTGPIPTPTPVPDGDDDEGGLGP